MARWDVRITRWPADAPKGGLRARLPVGVGLATMGTGRNRTLLARAWVVALAAWGVPLEDRRELMRTSAQLAVLEPPRRIIGFYVRGPRRSLDVLRLP